ncbi:DUF1553 domain-containing protein [Bryobacter aggregatus]|uniref:DUF1553 domain-containing protein n=1 Tax=Bryobacter aggregatus TaxID=360054 RepID=UPI0004E156CC|nr:DUF1553 domain-containing protein [Bryobacter aggregatus]
MKYALSLFVVAAFAQAPLSLRIAPSTTTLRGADDSQQLAVTAVYPDGIEHDVTANVSWRLSNPALVEVSATALLRARADGNLKLTASYGGKSVETQVIVQNSTASNEFQFARDIGNVLTRKGCNGAGCHGGVKGRGGLKLSSGVLYPKDDYEWIVKGGVYQVLSAEAKGERTPRVNTKEPEKSLILLKATNSIPHGGGRRFALDSPEYRSILDWVRKGAPYGPEVKAENRVSRLEVYPATIALESKTQQRLIVTAHFADGTQKDFTHQALYASNNKEVATVDEAGIVKAKELGETAIVVRAAGQAASATVGVMGAIASKYPDTPRTNFIDEQIFEKLRRFRIVPSELSSDSEFIRRLCLDLTGTLPPPARVREFLTNKDPKKREKLIDTLIGSPEFVDYWTFRFDDVFRVSVNANALPKWSNMYAEWIRTSIATNKPYDQIARERLVGQGYTAASRHFLPYDVIAPINETMAEEVRVFFGRRLDCAQCHNHPYETWSQDQFWGMAAFYGRMFKLGDNGVADDYVVFDHPVHKSMGNADVDANIKVFHPRTKAELKPALLDGRVIEPQDHINPRTIMADWMVKNPFFAEAIVNRMWSYFFGRGIVDPVDDFRSTNPPTHPALLNELADSFRNHRHDLRALIRTIVLSRTYQLSSQTRPDNASDHTNYSHFPPRALDAEVLLDAISDVTGVAERFTIGIPDGQSPPRYAPLHTRAITLRQPETFYSRFLELYGRPNRLTIPERSGKANLGQALHMVAGNVYNEKLASPAGRLQQRIDAGKSDAEIIDEFYLAALSRLPEAQERSALLKLVSTSSNRAEALRDFVWALICSREFAENH